MNSPSKYKFEVLFDFVIFVTNVTNERSYFGKMCLGKLPYTSGNLARETCGCLGIYLGKSGFYLANLTLGNLIWLGKMF
jgi:hypothetical protein